MPALDLFLQQKLQLLDAKHAARSLTETRPLGGGYVMRAGKKLLSFAGNDYLGLSEHPDVILAATQAIEAHGAGAGASRLITGNHPHYAALETALAKAKNTEAACVFGSGYLANIGVLPALMSAGDLILMDKYAHACMLDGARLSGAALMRFAHNNLDHLQMLLEAHRGEHHHCLIASETIFSMDGDRAPVAALAALAKRYDAWLYLDAAHDLYEPSVLHYPDSVIHIGTLSKALGAYGGYVCGSNTLIQYLKSAARSLVFSTGLPPSAVAAAHAALQVIKASPDLSLIPVARAREFAALLGLTQPHSAIVPVVLEENERALAASHALEEKGFLVAAIRPPTVPQGTARLRITFTSQHSSAQVSQLADAIQSGGWI